jgi:hypothetical protein
MSNNIIHGETPHKDFISIRPVASSLLALYSFFPIFESVQLFVTRIVCALEFVTIVWFWLQIMIRFSSKRVPNVFIVAITIIATTINIHDFPLMAWHTIDGILFSSLALLIRTKYQDKPTNSSLFFSYLFLGIAVLCKQSFAPMIIVSLIVFHDYKRIFPYIGILLFPLVYLGWITVNGGFFDIVVQLTAQSKVLGVGFKRYLIDFWFLSGIFVGISFWLSQLRFNEQNKQTVNIFFLSLMVFFLLIDLTIGNNLSKSSVFLFGVFIPIAIKEILVKRPTALVVVLVTVLAWSSALSIGYSFPALLSGGMVLVLFLILDIEIPNNWKTTSLSFVLIVCFVTSFVFARTTKIYQEQSAQHLHYQLGEVLINGKGIYTNANTFFFLYDVQAIRKKHHQKVIVFAPDMAGLYSSMQYSQPTISPWARDIELPSHSLKTQFEQNVEELTKTPSLFVISKYKVDSLAYKLITFNTETSDSPIVRFAKNNLHLVDSTRFFYIYTK